MRICEIVYKWRRWDLETEYYQFKGQFYVKYEKYREWGYKGGQKYYEEK